MAGKELDPARKQAALEVVKQHPGMVAAMAAPAAIIVVAGWVLGGAGLGLLLLVAFGVLGAVGVSRLLRKR
ncbi:putative protein OS=Tsukamurella paurometabola (strain ATCC 8368 / DSM / CCUG 35730 /CIP 100753 / JCM 10117 / KCTC 9821 / NBRC 16120 / NCIMB 702349/ NCTC 13040) OX=521096 GN=Tpau_0782 PE=4 SV=1 [Tsukamurella paurometabola]|uniref:Uncharacterized protein n=1 Tax=Tsukamurella paurometabola (strain ATCC 8368 / DSM 20162 / CCUG 35730 / CIP 100753 / JCM 10117 / KCTC 9821 / NBRC 16120 / NCIMB 702349 / NCTC 13040) TaxID=521096 RepID=D5UTR4_TSUPD|nr:hypothetical protein [Tsukamurella paurometabola]ADG77418.1 conserved hypothetical protein [Tsukamurella paurometabola DSM 20162]SUP26967.1 Uncharacterised protein [Tsukamurella paurometabola]